MPVGFDRFFWAGPIGIGVVVVSYGASENRFQVIQKNETRSYLPRSLEDVGYLLLRLAHYFMDELGTRDDEELEDSSTRESQPFCQTRLAAAARAVYDDAAAWAE